MVSAGSKKGRLSSKDTLFPEPELASLVYHDIFDYPMTRAELKKWKFGPKTKSLKTKKARKMGQYYFLAGREKIVAKRRRCSAASLKKIELAKDAARILERLPSVKMVALTGALAMSNADVGSDVDLLIVTAAGSLWTTRLLVYATLDLRGVPRRRYGTKKQKDRLCLNMWLDQNDLVWDEVDRNLYTAHEIAQVTPLVNRDRTYEKLIHNNSWIRRYWPNAIKIPKSTPVSKSVGSPFYLLEPFARSLQFWYMRSKITREVVTPTRAIFHPRDWGKIVALRLLARLN